MIESLICAAIYYRPRKRSALGELAKIHKGDGTHTFASVLRIDGEEVTLQVFENTRGIATNDQVTFLGQANAGYL